MKMESDLEEGEIPEFEVPPYVSSRSRKRRLLGYRRVHSLTPLNAHDKIKKGSKRYGSPPLEGEYMYGEEKLVMKNRIVQKPLHKSNPVRKAPKNLHPIQPTYESLEVIMTKIDESLGRRSDYYYKERRSKGPRYMVAINDSRNINSVLRKTSPVFKRMECNYYNKRRYSETNSESVNNIREKYGKIKSKKSFDARRSGKDITKKRKRRHSEICEGSTDKVDKYKKQRLFEQKEKGRSERNEKLKKHELDTRVFKEIPLSQEPEPELQEKNVKKAPKSENFNCVLNNPQDSRPHMVEASNFDDPPSVVLNGDSAMINSIDKPEQLNDEDDDDDDDDLVKLRLLALTSNKRKSQSFTNNCLDTVKDLGKSTEGSTITESKSSVADDEKTKDNPSSSNDEAVKKRGFDNDIDRYELFLRAEALKTALLKKHQRILKKRKTFSAISRNSEVKTSENSNRNNLVKRNEMDIDIISDEELLEKNLDGDSSAQLEVTENFEKLEIKDINKSDSESGKEDKTIDINHQHGLHLENLAITMETGHSEKSSAPAESSTLEPDKVPNDVDINVKNTSAGAQSVKKKAKRIRQKQSKKSDLNEMNIKKNNVACENKDVCQKTKFGYSPSPIDKNKADVEKKFFLADTVALSNPEINTASITSNSQSSLDAKQNHKSISTQKAAVLINEEPAAKIPESERIIVHLGSDSSDEECVPDIEPDQKSRTAANVESEKVNPLESVTNENNIKEFERSVDLLLSGARKKLESSAELMSEIPATPEAVYSHLAPSQRLEYMRLKQKIAEREKLRKAEKNNLNNSAAETNKSGANSTEQKIISPIITPRKIGKTPVFGQNVGDNKRTLNFKNRITYNEVRNPPNKNYAVGTPNYGGLGNSKSVRINQFSKLKNPVPRLNSEKESISTLKKDLTDSNWKNTIKKGPSEIIIERKKMLNQNRLNLERLKILWKNIKIEKMVEAKYETEIKKLKIQQNFFELKINQQRLKIKRMADESKLIYEAFQKNNRKVEVYSKKKRNVAKAENEAKKIEDSAKVTTEKNNAKDKDIGKHVAKGKEIGKDVAKGKEIGKHVAKGKETGKDVEKNEEIGKDVEMDKEIGKDIEMDKEIGKDIEKNEEIGKDVEMDKETGKNIEMDKEIGKDIEMDKEIGKDVEMDKEIEIDFEMEKEIGKDIENEEIGKDVEMDKETGKDIEENEEIGKDVEMDKEIGKDVEKDKEIEIDFEMEKEFGKDIENEEIGKDVETDKEIGKHIEKDKEIEIDVAKRVIPGAVENDVRLIAEDTQIGVNEKREEMETKAGEKIGKEKNSDAKETAAVTNEADWLKEYKSPLENLTKRSESSDCPRIDPNIIMCQYDLLGKCNDEECVFQHWRA